MSRAASAAASAADIKHVLAIIIEKIKDGTIYSTFNSAKLCNAITYLFVQLPTDEKIKEQFLIYLKYTIQNQVQNNRIRYALAIFNLYQCIDGIDPYNVQITFEMEQDGKDVLKSFGYVPAGPMTLSPPSGRVQLPSTNSTNAMQVPISGEDSVIDILRNLMDSVHFGEIPIYNATFVGLYKQEMGETIETLFTMVPKMVYTRIYEIIYENGKLIPIDASLLNKPNGFLIYLWYMFEWLMSYIDTLHDHEENSKLVIGEICRKKFLEKLKEMDTHFGSRLEEIASKHIDNINATCYTGSGVSQRACKMYLLKLCDEWLSWISDSSRMPAAHPTTINYAPPSTTAACQETYQFYKSIPTNSNEKKHSDLEKNTKAARACNDVLFARGVKFFVVDSEFSSLQLLLRQLGMKKLCTAAESWDAACTVSGANTNVAECIKSCSSSEASKVYTIPAVRILGCRIEISNDGTQIRATLDDDPDCFLQINGGPHSLSVGSISEHILEIPPPRSETSREFNKRFELIISPKLGEIKSSKEGLEIFRVLGGSFKGATDKLQALAALELSRHGRVQVALETIDLCFLPLAIAMGLENILINTPSRQLIHYATNMYALEDTNAETFKEKKKLLAAIIGFLIGGDKSRNYSENLKDFTNAWFSNLSTGCTIMQKDISPVVFWCAGGIIRNIPKYADMSDKEIKRLDSVKKLLEKSKDGEALTEIEKKVIESEIMAMPSDLKTFMINLLNSKQLGAELNTSHAKLCKIREGLRLCASNRLLQDLSEKEILDIPSDLPESPAQQFVVLCGKLTNIIIDSGYVANKSNASSKNRDNDVKIQTACTMVAFSIESGITQKQLIEYLLKVQHTALDAAIEAITKLNPEFSIPSKELYIMTYLLSTSPRGKNEVRALKMLKAINSSTALEAGNNMELSSKAAASAAAKEAAAAAKLEKLSTDLFYADPNYKNVMEMTSLMSLCVSYMSTVNSARCSDMNVKNSKSKNQIPLISAKECTSWSAQLSAQLGKVKLQYDLSMIAGLGFADLLVEVNDLVGLGLQLENDDINALFRLCHNNGNERRKSVQLEMQKRQAQTHPLRGLKGQRCGPSNNCQEPAFLYNPLIKSAPQPRIPFEALHRKQSASVSALNPFSSCASGACASANGANGASGASGASDASVNSASASGASGDNESIYNNNNLLPKAKRPKGNKGGGTKKRKNQTHKRQQRKRKTRNRKAHKTLKTRKN